MEMTALRILLLMIFFCAQVTAWLNEPACPQYDRFTFEEKVLEKMVRGEHKLELIEEKLKMWEKNLDNKLTEIDKAEVEREKTVEEKLKLWEKNSNNKLIELDEAEVEREKTAEEKLVELESDVDTKLQEFVNTEKDRKVNAETLQAKHNQQLEEQKVQLETAIADLKKQTEELTKAMADKQLEVEKALQEKLKLHEASLKAVTEQYQTPAVAFQATQTSEIDTKSAVLKFDAINLNMGNAYDSATGIFTAPKEGIYSFTIQLCVHSDKVMSAKMLTNDKKIVAAIYNTDKSNGVCVSSSGVVFLNQGQTVSVEGDAASTSTTHRDNRCINLFSGVLIHSS